MIQLDMSEYMEKHTVSRLIGSPPGYVGYEEGGQLTEAVRRKPFSVVLFDEIEKAHPDVFNTLLQILEDGHLTDAQGHKVDFKNTIIIMTSNLGTRDIAKGVGIGFMAARDDAVTYTKMKENVTEELKRSFRPEFLNRIDEVIVFHSLTIEDVKRIVDLLMRRVEEQLKSKDVDIELSDAAKTLLAERGYDKALGARPLATDDPTAGRGPARREAAVQGVPSGGDDHRRRPRRRDHVRARGGCHAPGHAARGARGLDRVGRARVTAAPLARHEGRSPVPLREPGFSASEAPTRTGRRHHRSPSILRAVPPQVNLEVDRSSRSGDLDPEGARLVVEGQSPDLGTERDLRHLLGVLVYASDDPVFVADPHRSGADREAGGSAPTCTWYLTSFVAGSIRESVPTLWDSAHTATSPETR